MAIIDIKTMDRIELLQLQADMACCIGYNDLYNKAYNTLLNKYNFCPELIEDLKHKASLADIVKLLEFNNNFNHEV